MPAPRPRGHWHAVMQAAGQPSETLANQPARSEANKQPPYPPARQSASQPAIRMPPKHLLLPAMRLSLYPSPPSLPSIALSPSPFPSTFFSPCFSLSLSHSHTLSLCAQLPDICRGWHGGHISRQRIPGECGKRQPQQANRSDASLSLSLSLSLFLCVGVRSPSLIVVLASCGR